MNVVTAITMNNILAFLVLIVAGGLLSSPTVGFATLIALPFFVAFTTPLFQGMRNGPIRLRLEARAFLGIQNGHKDYALFGSLSGNKLKRYLNAAHVACKDEISSSGSSAKGVRWHLDKPAAPGAAANRIGASPDAPG